MIDHLKSARKPLTVSLLGVALFMASGAAFAAPQILSAPEMRSVPVPVRGWQVGQNGHAYAIAQIDPIQVDDYVWSAEKAADGSIILQGYVPSLQVQNALFAAAGRRSIDASSVASGAPDGFSGKSLSALTLLLALHDGKVAFDDGHWLVSGHAASPVARDYVERLVSERNLRAEGWKIDVAVSIEGSDAEPAEPQVTQTTLKPEEQTHASESDVLVADEEVASKPEPMFGFAARKVGDRWLLGGNAPISAFQTYIETHFGMKATGQLVVADAPDGFAASAIKGLEALQMLESGQLLFNRGSWTLVGKAASGDVANTVMSSLGEMTRETQISVAEPDMMSSPAEEADSAAAEAPLPLPSANPYRWSAEISPESGLVVSGYVPTTALESHLKVRASQAGDVDVSLASGAPDNFSADVFAGLEALETLGVGRVSFDGSSWTLATVSQAASETQAIAALGARAENWMIVLPELAEKSSDATPEVAEPLPLPTANPYRWSARVDADGAIGVDGFVPVESLKAFLDVRAGSGNHVQLAAGAPDGFSRSIFAALSALESLSFGQVIFDGTSWSISGEGADEVSRTELISALPDGWIATISVPALPVELGAPDYAVSAEKREDGTFVVTGNVPAEATKSFASVYLGEAASGLTVRDGAPQGFAAAFAAGIRALARMDTGTLTYSDLAWSFSGKSADAGARDAAGTDLAALSGPPNWTVDISGPTPLEVCTDKVVAFDERNAILFDAGSARISRDSRPALNEAAEILAACPEAMIVVEGHTDADGDEESNLILSVARAEAVVDELVGLGIGEKRLYAVGYGESLPIASNETNAGKQRNRRIVLSVSDSAQLAGVE